MKIVNSFQMSEIDRISIEKYGIPAMILMENAGKEACDVFLHQSGAEKPAKIVIFAGPGHNGGDGLVIARQAHLKGYNNISIIYPKYPEKGLCSTHAEICRNLGIPYTIWENSPSAMQKQIENADFIIDSLSGTGIKGELRSPVKEMVTSINKSNAVTFAVDVPSGLGDEFLPHYSVVDADYTITMGLPKNCLYTPSGRVYCGKVSIVSPGFPTELTSDETINGEFVTPKELPALIPHFEDSDYKNTRGRVGIFAGSPGTSGAGILTATACARSLAGLVTLFAHSDVYTACASQAKSIMVQPWHPETSNIDEVPFEQFSTLAVGPGWGTQQDRLPWLRHFFERDIPGVLDADGITLLSQLSVDPPDLRGQWILTPHPGEFMRLSNVDRKTLFSKPFESIYPVARKYNAIIILKTHVIWIVTPDGQYSVADGMNAALGTGGSGDVLTGILAGFLSSGMEPYQAARAGVLFHQELGTSVKKKKGWFIAEDLADAASWHLGMLENYHA